MSTPGHDRRPETDRPASMKPKLLILSFSPIASDARVLKQVDLFAEDYEVTTCGYGPAPAGATARPCTTAPLMLIVGVALTNVVSALAIATGSLAV